MAQGVVSGPIISVCMICSFNLIMNELYQKECKPVFIEAAKS